MTPTLPTIHIDGTAPRRLEDEYAVVRQRIAAAGNALEAATCNVRDFWLHEDPSAWQRAQDERAEAFRLLQLVSDYAEQWETHAADHRRAHACEPHTHA